MQPLPYKVIKYKAQYESYRSIRDFLREEKKLPRNEQDALELLTVLTEKWEQERNISWHSDPVEALSYMMVENGLRPTDLAKELEISRSLVSDILHYRRRLSQNLIRRLTEYFSVPQELFSRPYELE